MRFKQEEQDGANAGLDKVRKYLDTIKEKHKEISHSDLWAKNNLKIKHLFK